jgi:hypothetical protein
VRYRTTERRLRPGDRLTFGRVPAPGRPGPSADPHLGLSPSPALHAMAGRLSVDAAGCVLDNTGRWLRLRVLHLDGVERSDLDPGRGLRIPWARSRVEVAVDAEPLWFGLAVPQRSGTPVGVPDAGGDTQRGLGLDRSAGYFRALVALCEPRLRDPGSDAVASAGDIARRLTASGQEQGRVSQKAIERRLANVRQRLGIGAEDPFGGSAAGLELRDASRVLVDLVLRTGTVTRADLALLDRGVGSG